MLRICRAERSAKRSIPGLSSPRDQIGQPELTGVQAHPGCPDRPAPAFGNGEDRGHPDPPVGWSRSHQHQQTRQAKPPTPPEQDRMPGGPGRSLPEQDKNAGRPGPIIQPSVHPHHTGRGAFLGDLQEVQGLCITHDPRRNGAGGPLSAEMFIIRQVEVTLTTSRE
jgi:hypothetical protein